jgi:Tfp pilus assembly major pilin PilA
LERPSFLTVEVEGKAELEKERQEEDNKAHASNASFCAGETEQERQDKAKDQHQNSHKEHDFIELLHTQIS